MMRQYMKDATDILPLFSYINAQYMIKSLLFRKQPKVDVIENSAMITWGPCLIIGGGFSDEILQMLKTKLLNAKNACYIYSPEGEWNSYIENRFPANLTEKQINLYKHQGQNDIDCQAERLYIMPITTDWLNLNLPNSQLIKNEIYSYLSVDDFLQNGFGLVLVIDDVVRGYCLSEYSIDGECAINIWIDEKYRRMGHAKTMTQLFLQHSKSKNWGVFWGCTSDNSPSNKVAQSTGFSIHSTQKYFEYRHL